MSGFDVKVENLEKTVQALSRFAKQQVPFAMSLALNRTVKDVQKALRTSLPQHFTIRQKGKFSVSSGIRLRTSNKKNLTAQVGSIDDYMALQGAGGTKRAQGKAMGVPIGARKDKTKKLLRDDWPGALLRAFRYVPPTPGKAFPRPGQRVRIFVGPIKGGPQTGIYIRMKRNTWKDKRRTPIKLMYAFKSAVHVPKRWPLDDTAKRVVKQMWTINAHAALLQACRTAKPPIPVE